jgi:hypothetical protein
MYEPSGTETIEILTNIVLFFIAVLFMFSVLVGYLEGPQQKTEVNSKSDLLEYFQDDEDIYAILTGDMDYLAAHCTLKEEPLPSPKQTKPKQTKPKQTKPKQTKPCTTEVGMEAVSGLVSLGYKKSEANQLVNDILSNNPNMTSDEVVMEVFNK